MADTEPWTIKRLLDWTTDHFKKRDPDNPRLRAEVLLAEALQCQRIELYTRFDSVPDDQPLATFRDWVKRHFKGEPVAYLVGYREFYSLRFLVGPNVLIPRPETEHLVMAAVEFLGKRRGSAEVDSPGDEVRVLDVGTGSGCVGITIARQFESCLVIATDISSEALEIAAMNAERLDVSDRIQFQQGDLLKSLDPNEKFDLIVSNPPYIGTDEKGTVDQDVRDFEPGLALFSGADGMTAITGLVQQAPDFLNPGGQLMFEMSPIIADKCKALIEQSDAFEFVQAIKDYSGHERISVAQFVGNS